MIEQKLKIKNVAGIDIRKMQRAQKRLKAMNHRLRYGIITYLRNEGSKTVTQIQIHFRLEHSVASQHLAVLRRADLVTANREGKNVHYSIDKENIFKFNQSVRNFLQDAKD